VATIVVETIALPALVIHGGAGAYLKTTTASTRRARGQRMADITRHAHASMGGHEAARRGVLAAIRALEDDPSFNAGYGARLQRDGGARVSAALMDGRQNRLSAVYNVEACRHPTDLCDILQDRPDRNLDGRGAAALMAELGIAPQDIRSPESLGRWVRLVESGEVVDREAAIGHANADAVDRARDAATPIPGELEVRDLPPEDDRYGTVGAVASADGELWAATSTGGRGHEAVGRVSDSPTPAGNYACPVVALSATGFGEQILDLNVCGRIATRMLDGSSLEAALRRTFAEVEAEGGLLGVIAITPDGRVGYAHSTEACGVAWVDGHGRVHVDRNGRTSG